MTLQERPRATEGALSLDVVKARITEWCGWFDLTPPKLKTREGQVYLTDELHEWMMTAGASYDWIFRGDAKGLAAAYRRELLSKLDAGDIAAAAAEADERMPELSEVWSLIRELENNIQEVKSAHCVTDILVCDVLSNLKTDSRLSSALHCSCEVMETRLDILEQHYLHLFGVARGLFKT